MAIIEDLIVNGYGVYLGLHGGRLRVSSEGKTQEDVPLLHLQSVHVVTRSASISASALYACCHAGIPIHFVDSMEGHYASVLSPQLTTVVVTRRAQLEAVQTECGVAIGKQLCAGKIRSQVTNLRYIAKRLEGDLQLLFKQTISDLLAYADRLESLEATNIEEVRATMMGIEGMSSRLYWNALGQLIPEDYGWQGRTGRHATDPANMLLNYGYGILYGEVQNALALAGLEPYAGLIHTDRPGKPSLTCDLIEEFRAPIVDRTVMGLLNRHYEVKLDEDGKMEREFRKEFAEHILSRLHAQAVYDGKRLELRSIIQRQARRLARAFRQEEAYVSYTGG
jgi:CRISP-associated protein Cas1